MVETLSGTGTALALVLTLRQGRTFGRASLLEVGRSKRRAFVCVLVLFVFTAVWRSKTKRNSAESMGILHLEQLVNGWSASWNLDLVGHTRRHWGGSAHSCGAFLPGMPLGGK